MASDIRGEQDQKAFLFNCAQRGAHNPHESYTIALAGLVRFHAVPMHVSLFALNGFVWRSSSAV